MNRAYTVDKMLEWLEKHFKDDGYDVDTYSDEFLPVRVPLYCVKKEQNKIIDEMVIEITTDEIISKASFFPTLPIGKVLVQEASPARFYQYYFPYAKIFYAYPDYVRASKKFDEFKQVCIKRGIGLLKTSKNNIEKVVDSHSLYNDMCNQLINKRKSRANIESTIGNYLDSAQHYLVYYPEPVYKRRAIIGRTQEQIGYVLIDKLLKLKKIAYKGKLIELASKYRQEVRDDYDIALKYIADLWEDRLGLKYPEIHMHLEEILLRDEMYREHFVHQFQVLLTGAYILDKLYKTKGFLMVIQSFEKKYKCKIEDAWLAASTYHDFNYGLQNFDIWLLRFFSDTLSIENEEAKENLNLLNLDAVMVREFLSDIIRKLVELLKLDKNTEKKARKFLYEKAVRDRNHGLLSALSILKLCEIHKQDLKVSFDAMLQAAFAITCHDEDIWEAFSGCKGYLKSNLPECGGGRECNRELWNNKKVAVHKRDVSHSGGINRKCEIWEQEVMEKAIISKIKFDKWPLLFLLIYCDSVQEEGRITSTPFSNAPTFENEFRIEIEEFIINEWVGTRKPFGEFMQAAQISNAFTNKSCKLSNEARIYKIDDRKWKIVDKNSVYIIEKKRRMGIVCKVRRKECSLDKIDVDSRSSRVKVDLAIDGLVLKLKELERVSWVLEDKRFTVHLEEKDTKENKDIVINGSGGG